MPSATRPKLTARRRIIAAAALLGSAAALAGVLFATGAGGSSTVATSIPALAPADADTFVLAPYSPSWWANVSSMTSPDTGVAGLDPGRSGADITAVGYSRSPDHEDREVPMTGPQRLFYIEASSAEDAKKVAEWLKHSEGFETRRVFIEGNVVIVAASWVNEFKAPDRNMNGVAGYTDTVSTGEASMYRNPDLEVQTLTGSTDSGEAKALTTVMRKGFGFTEGTTWVGTSIDGSSWAGDFRSGGVDPGQIDFDEIKPALNTTSVKIAEYTVENMKYEGYSGGLANILMSSTFRQPDKSVLGPDVALPGLPKVRDEAVSVVSDVTGWTAAASGIYSARENITTQATSASERSMVMSLGYRDVQDAGK